MIYYSTPKKYCQDYEKAVNKIFKKLRIKKEENKKVINWLKKEKEIEKANNINECGTFVGIYNENNTPKIMKANFCRERLCCVCAWRRQSKFIAQMTPVLQSLEKEGYKFIFATLTIKNCIYKELEKQLNIILDGFAKLRHKRKIQRVWKGICRSVELTYNKETNTYHPHMHLLIAVDGDYFTNSEKYITQEELTIYWEDIIKEDYKPIVDIRKVYNKDKATVETLKYSLKPSQYNEGLKAFHYILKGRRLISFTGIIAKRRKELKLLDFELELNDDIEIKNNIKMSYDVYKLDCTGGLYKFYNTYELN